MWEKGKLNFLFLFLIFRHLFFRFGIAWCCIAECDIAWFDHNIPCIVAIEVILAD